MLIVVSHQPPPAVEDPEAAGQPGGLVPSAETARTRIGPPVRRGEGLPMGRMASLALQPRASGMVARCLSCTCGIPEGNLAGFVADNRMKGGRELAASWPRPESPEPLSTRLSCLAR